MRYGNKISLNYQSIENPSAAWYLMLAEVRTIEATEIGGLYPFIAYAEQSDASGACGTIASDG